MRSILFSLGDFPIYSYGVSIALGLLSAHFVIVRLGRREGLGPDFAANILMAIIVSAIAGARIAYVMEHWTSVYAANPVSIFHLRSGGLMFYGGFILAVITTLVFIKIAKLRLLPVLDVLATALPLAHAFGRFGCFVNGCCHGRLSGTGAFERAVSVVYPRGSHPWAWQVGEELIDVTDTALPMFPSQLVESGANLAIFALLLALAFVPKIRPGIRTGLYLICYAVARSFVETLRSDVRMTIGALTIAQTISIGVFAAGAAILVFALLRKNNPQSANAA